VDNKWLQFYFSFTGRATRYDFNVRYLLTVFVATMIWTGLSLVIWPLMALHGVYAFLVMIAGFAVTCRRLHDLNLSGWWQLLVYCIPSVLTGIFAFTIGLAVIANPFLAGFWGMIGMGIVGAVWLIYILTLSLKRGTVGVNKYGVDPLQIVEIPHV
jgi:uncharacterized membrane protein YhaH (DUF805 family)